MAKFKKWTREEDQILIDAVNEAETIKEGIKIAADILEHKNDKRCTNRWYGVLSKKKEDEPNTKSTPTNHQISTNNNKILFTELKDSADSFLEILKQIQTKNKNLSKQVENQQKRIDEQARLIRDMDIERKEIEESYTYILRVIEKARKMFVEEETHPKTFETDINGVITSYKEAQV